MTEQLPIAGPEGVASVNESHVQHPTPKGEVIETLILPSGETWDIVTRPKFGRVQNYLRNLGNNSEDSGNQLADTVLAFTSAWSYKDADGHPLPIVAESLEELDSFDVFEVIGKTTEILEPFLASLVKVKPEPST